MIIGVSGRIFSGKDTVGKMIQDLDPKRSWQIKKFAGKLKQIATILTGIPVEKFEDQEFKKSALPFCWDKEIPITTLSGVDHGLRPMTVRDLLQVLGTEALRDNLHKNVWVNALFADYVCASEGIRYEKGENTFTPKITPITFNPPLCPNWIITDCRFPNEAQDITDKGGFILKVTRPGEDLTATHASETALDNWSFDEIIVNDGTLDDLKEKVRLALIKFNLYE